jgi:outer membrane lipoprotein SlyB
MKSPVSHEAPAARQAHPIVIIAGIAVTLFSLAGIGAIMGWIPTSIGGGAPAVKSQPESAGPLAQAPEPPKAQAQAARPAAPKPVAKEKTAHPKAVAQSEPLRPAAPDVAPPPAAPIVAAVCRECAVIEDIREVEKDGEASGVGAVGGAVVGGVLGHQVGRGRGKDVATVLGAVGGAVAGHQIEKNVKKTKQYEITVRYEDGNRGMFTQDTPPAWRPGDKVKIIDGVIRDRG